MNNNGLYDLAYIEAQLNMFKEQHDNDIKYICESLRIKTPRELKAQLEVLKIINNNCKKEEKDE